MSDRYYLTSGGHILISGPTGAGERYGGKSTTADWWQDNLLGNGWVDMSVSIDPGGAGYTGMVVNTLEELAEAFKTGTRQFVWPHAERVDALVETVDRLPGTATIVFDEAWMYPESEGMENCIRNLGNQDEPVTGLVVSQRAWDLPDSIRNSCPLKVWVGPMTNEGEKYFKTSGMGHVPDEVDPDPYQWVVTDGGELIDVNEPVPESYA